MLDWLGWDHWKATKMSASTPSSHVRQQSLTGKSATGFPTAQSEHTAPEQDQEEEEDVDMQMDQQVEQPALTEQQQQTEIESSGTANVRAPSRSIYVPIVYGTMSWWMGNPDPNSEKQHSHRWKAYVRGADGRDISYAVRSVIFKLHPSYTNTDRGTLRLLYVNTWSVYTLLSRHFVSSTSFPSLFMLDRSYNSPV